MNQKMTLTTIGFFLTFLNLMLVDTKYNIIGLCFGIIAALFFIKAIRTKPND